MLLVDDVLGVRPVLTDRAAAERLGAELVARYFARTPALPRYHARIAAERGLGAADMLRHDDARWIFSERELRTALVTHVHRELRTPGETLGGGVRERRQLHDYREPSGARRVLPGAFRAHELRGRLCGVVGRGASPGCAHAGRDGADALPCAVSVGTAIARELYALRDLRVVNVAIGDPETNAPAVVTRTRWL